MQLEPDPGSIFIIWANAGALSTPLEPSKSTSLRHCGLALAGLLLSWWHRALRRDASAATRGWVVCCSDGSGDHDDRSCVAFAYGRAVWMGPEAPWSKPARARTQAGARWRVVGDAAPGRPTRLDSHPGGVRLGQTPGGNGCTAYSAGDRRTRLGRSAAVVAHWRRRRQDYGGSYSKTSSEMELQTSRQNFESRFGGEFGPKRPLAAPACPPVG